jgi:hypothetical protein
MQAERRTCRRRLFPCVTALTSILLTLPARTTTADPDWWSSRGVIESNAVPADYAPALLGQLKWFATNAYTEVETNLAAVGGAGAEIENVVFASSATDNYCVVTLGQLKRVAAPFYDRLIAVGAAGGYPWTTDTADDRDFAVANVGQLKNVFAFQVAGWGAGDPDGDGLPDDVETGTGVFVGPSDTGSNPNLADTDEDGLGDGEEVDARTDPNNSDTSIPAVVVTFPVDNYRIIWMP